MRQISTTLFFLLLCGTSCWGQDNLALESAAPTAQPQTQMRNVRNILARIAELEKSRIGQPRIVSGSVHRSLTPVAGQTDDKAAMAETKTDFASTKRTVELVTAESMLLDLVRSSFHNDQWQKSGQGLATIKIIGGIAVVNCNSEMADELRGFLADLDYHLSRD